MLSGNVRAVEFYSGIGAFAEAAQSTDIRIVAAFDQSQTANLVYEQNFGLRPRSRNLDSIPASELPPADLWWMSPPCKPFTVRGRRRDELDPRAVSFLNLIGLLPLCQPQAVMVENVGGFADSRVKAHLISVLSQSGYTLKELDLCPTDFGVPMRRPRHFVLAVRSGFRILEAGARRWNFLPLPHFLEPDPSPALTVEASTMTRHSRGFDVVDPSRPDASLICFTSGYGRCLKASGSFISMPDGQVRRLSPEEILRLLGFGESFRLPPKIDLRTCWRLVGNSVDVRSVRHLLSMIGLSTSRNQATRQASV